MASNKHFPNAIYANRDVKLDKILPAVDDKACFTHRIFTVAKFFINLTPAFITFA